MVATDGETGRGIRYTKGFYVICQVWKKENHNERPNVGGVY